MLGSPKSQQENQIPMGAKSPSNIEVEVSGIRMDSSILLKYENLATGKNFTRNEMGGNVYLIVVFGHMDHVSHYTTNLDHPAVKAIVQQGKTIKIHQITIYS